MKLYDENTIIEHHDISDVDIQVIVYADTREATGITFVGVRDYTTLSIGLDVTQLIALADELRRQGY